MTAHDLARLLLAKPDEQVLVDTSDLYDEHGEFGGRVGYSPVEAVVFNTDPEHGMIVLIHIEDIHSEG